MVGAMDGNDPAPKQGWARWRGPVLFVSLGLNLFLIGIMLGGVVRHPFMHHWLGRDRMAAAPHVALDPPPPPPLRQGGPAGGGPVAGGPGGGNLAQSFRQAIQALPEADKRIFDESMESARAESRRAQPELRQARQRVNDAIRAEPFDKQALLQALAEVRQRQDAIQLRLHTDTAEAMARLSPEARRQFADQTGPRPRP